MNQKNDEYIKEFKGICYGLATTHKYVDEDNKVINFARGLGLKYNTFMTLMLGNILYQTFNHFIYTLTDFDIRENEEKRYHNKIITCMVLSVQRGRR